MQKNKITYCLECEKEGIKNYFITNKIHSLCNKHNKARLYGFNITKNIIKPLKRVSIKETINKDKLKVIYQEISQEREHICSGCGNKNNLSHSHLIPRSRRKDLELDKENIKYHCLVGMNGEEGCHSKWESNILSKMKYLFDYEDNLNYLSKVDKEYYYFVINKLSENK